MTVIEQVAEYTGSKAISMQIVRVDGTDYLCVETDQETGFIFPVTWENATPTIGHRVHPMSPVRRKVAAAWRATQRLTPPSLARGE